MLAEADEQAVARRYLLIGPQRHLVRIECRDRIRGKRPLGGVGQRDVLHEELRLRRNAALRDGVVRERRARIADGCQRIVDRRPAAEITGALFRSRHDHVDDVTLIAALTLVAGEEERPAFQNRTTQRAAELIALEVLLLRSEEVLRVERVVSQELEGAPVEGVRAGFGDGVERAASAVDLRRIGVLLDAELLQRVDRRLDPRAALMLFGDVDAVEQEACLLPADAADDVAVDDFRPHGLHVAGRRQQRRTRRQLRELVKAAAVQRQVDDLFISDDVAQRRRFGVQQR